MSDLIPSKFAQEEKQPLFTAISSSDPHFQDAYARASQTLPSFIAHIQSGMRGYFSAKLRFRDPNEAGAYW